MKFTTKSVAVNAIANLKYEPESKIDYDSSNDNMVASIANTTLQIKPKITTLQIGNKKLDLLIDSGSSCSILNESLATEIINNSSLARWLTTASVKELKIFAIEPFPVIVVMQTSVDVAEFVLVGDGLKPLLSLDWFNELGISVTYTLNPIEGSMINNITTQFE